MANFCGNCGQKVDAKTGLCPQCDQAILMKKKKRKKSVRVVIAILCCISIIAVGIFGALRFFNKDTVSYTYGEYNSFMEGFTDVLVTDEKSAIEAVGSIADVLGINDVSKELSVVNKSTVSDVSYYRLQQNYDGIPIYGKSVALCVDEQGKALALTSNTGSYNTPDAEVKRTNDDYITCAEKYIKYDKLYNVQLGNKLYVPYGNKDITLCYPVEVTYSYENLIYTKILYVSSKELSVIKEIDLIDNNIFISGVDGTKKEYSSVELLGDKDGSNYLLVDNERNIYCSYVSNDDDKVTDNIATTSDGQAVDAFVNMQTIVDYFNRILQINSFDNDGSGILLLISRDGYLSDQALSAPIDTLDKAVGIGSESFLNYAAIMLGEPNQLFQNSPANAIDVIGHEYTHRLIGNIVLLENNGIDEGICDIFGNLVELDNDSHDNIWGLGENTGYSKYDMSESVTMSSYDDTDDGHDNAAVIAHSAYLMWNGINGNENGKIDTTTLAKLWYNAVYMLQADADFSQCRNAVELSARAMLKNETITEEQYRTVVTAFERVGIENATFTYTETVKNQFDLSVLSSEGTDDVHFKLEVIKMPTIKAGPGIVNNEMPKLVMEKTAITGRQSLDLKDGTYVLRITDVSDERNISQSINIKIVVDGDNGSAKDEVVVNTDFTDVIVVILNEKPSDNKDEQNTDTTDAVLSPESAVDIYMANKNVWMENPEYMPMQGYGYCLLDLDFDGVLELINSTNDGSGRYSYNKFYRINPDKLTVEEFQTQSEQREGGIDYCYLAHQSKLLKNKSTGNLFYLFKDYLRVSTEEGVESYAEVYMKDNILYENFLFSEYWHPDYDNNTSNEIREYTFKDNDVFKSEYEQKTNAFYSENKNMNLVWKCISGSEFDKGANSTQKQLLLDAYRSYSYDGFSFDDIKTYDISPTDPEQPQLNTEKAKQYSIVDYYGMTINDVTKIWGKDYTIMNGLIGGGWGGIYYEDKRCPFTFCFKSTSMPAKCDGDEILSGIIVYPEMQDDDFFAVDDIKLVCSLSEVSQKLNGTSYENELYGGQSYSCELENGVLLGFTWIDNNNLPSEISATFIR